MNPEVIDIHVHIGGPGGDGSGCYWSKKFEATAAYLALVLTAHSLFKRLTLRRLRKLLLNVVNQARYVDKVVLLALDEVYDEAGNCHPELSHLVVPNRYLADLAKKEDRALFGCSIHPFNPFALSELDFCVRNGAVLCKWIPSAQMINPAHKKCLPFYQKLVEYNLPLLVHAGPEYAIPSSAPQHYNPFNNPKYLRTPLVEGVTVIVAHCALPYFWIFDPPMYQNDYHEFLNLFDESQDRNWNLYADISAICTPMRAEYVSEIQARIPPERLLFGSDYPIPFSELSYQNAEHFCHRLYNIIKAMLMQNPLDKNYLLIKNMGFDERVFINAGGLFERIRRN